MNKRTLSVDFGPLTLPVNGAQDSWEPAFASGGVSERDALSLQRLMKRDEAAVMSPSEGDIPAAGGSPGHGGYRLSNWQGIANAVKCLKLASSIAEATAKVANRIELQLNEHFFAGSSLSVGKSAYGLEFELRVVDPESLDQLRVALDAIASEVGTHLQVAVALRLFSGSDALLIKEAGWPPGYNAC